MAISDRYRSQILARLPSQYRGAYEAGDISDDQLELFAQRIGLEAPADFSGVSARATSTEEAVQPETPFERRTRLTREEAGGLVDALQSSIQGTAAGLIGSASRSDNPFLRSLADTASYFGDPETLVRAASGNFSDNMAGDFASEMRTAADLNRAQAQRATEAAASERTAVLGDILASPFNALAQAQTDLAGSATSAASLIPGGATISMGDVYAQEYDRARAAGLSDEDAKLRAASMASGEAIGFLPLGKAIERVPVVGEALKRVTSSTAKRVIARTLARSAEEGTNEALTQAAQIGTNAVLAETASDPTARQYAKQQIPLDIWADIRRAGAAGALAGGVLTAPGEHYRAIQEDAQLASDFLNADTKRELNVRAPARRAADRTARTEAGPSLEDVNRQLEQLQLFPDLAPGATSELPGEPATQPGDEPDVGAFDQRRSVIEGLMNRERQNITRLEEAQSSEAQLAGTGYEGTSFGQFEAGALERARARLAQLESDLTSMRGLPARQGTLSLNTPRQPRQTATNTQTRGGDTYYTPEGVQRSRVDDEMLVEANKLLSSQQRADARKAKDDFKKATADYKKRQTQFNSDVLERSRSVPQAERAQFIAGELRNWRESNRAPVEADFAPAVEAVQANQNIRSAEQAAQAVTPTTTRGPSKATMEAYRANFPEASDAELQQMIADDQAGASTVDNLAMQPSATTSNLTSQDLVNAVMKKIGTKQGNTLAKLVADGKLVFDDNASTAPVEAAGAYNAPSGQVHINASRIDPKQPIASILEQVAVHEFNHAAQVSGNADIKRKLGNFIGTKATDQIVKKLEAAAKTDPTAQRIIQNAKQGSTPNTYKLEVVAYAANEMKAKGQKSGAIRGAVNDLVSAVRTTAKKYIPGLTEDINLKDIGYLNDRLLQEAANTTGDLSGNIPNILPMIYNKESAGFQEALRNGWVYDSVDGNQKYVLSDADSTIKQGAKDKLAKTNRVWNLGDVMEHPVLYREHPEAANIPVYVVEGLPKNAFGQYDPNDKSITITRQAAASPELREYLMHEVQHFVQDVGGQGQNFFPYANNPQLREVEAEYNQVLEDNNTASRLVLDNARQLADNASPAQKKEILRVLFDRNATDFRKANEIVGILELEGVKLPQDQQRIINEFNLTLEQYRDVQPRVNEARLAAQNAYLSNITEREAFRTQDDVDVPESAVRARGNPEPQMREQEVDPETGIDLTRGRMDVPSQTLAMLSPSQLSDNMRNPNVNTAGGRAVQIAKSQFLYHSGLGKELYDRLQLSIGESAVDAQRGMNAGANIDNGIKALAKRTGQSREDARKMVEERMNVLAKLPNPAARQRALAAFVRQNPEMRALETAYSDIDHLTKTLVKQMLQTNPNPTETDRVFMNDLLNNSFGYTTRMYAAYQGEAGSEYSRKLMKDYNNAVKRTAKDKKLSPAQSAAMKKVDDAIEYLVNTDLTIPEAENIGEAKLEKIKYLYDTWIGDADQDYTLAYEAQRRAGASDSEARAMARTKLEGELIDFAPNVDTAQMQSRAKDAVDTMLGLSKTTGSVPQYLRTASGDRGILQKRQDLPESIRSLLGEITDPATRVAATIAKQGELAARTKFLLHMRDNGEGQWVVNPQSPSDGKFTAELNGEGFGPLNGWKTTPQIEAVINDQLAMYSALGDALAQGFAGADSQQSAWYRTVDDLIKKGAGAAKVASVILEGWGTLMNAVGSPVILAANGVINPRYWAQGVGSSADLVKNEIVNNAGQLTENTKRAIRLGVTDSAKVNELRDSVQRQVKDRIIGRGPVSRTGQGLQRAKRIGVEVFAQTDVWPKIAALNDNIDMLTKYYAAEGVEKSQAEIEQEAAQRVKDTNISSDRVPPALKFLEARGVTTFMPYFYNVPRSLVQSAGLGMRDFVDAFNATTPEGRMIKGWAGLKRVAGTSAATYGMVTGLAALAAAINGDDEEKVREAKKVLRPDARFAAPILLGKDEAGNPLFFRLGRIDPFGPVNDLGRMLSDPDVTAEEARTAGVKYLQDLAFANRFSKVVIDTLSATIGDGKIKDRTTRLERVLPESTSMLKEAARAMRVPSTLVESGVSTADILLPGQVDVFDPKNPRVAAESKAGGKALGDITRYLGGRLDRVEPGSRAFELGQEIKDARDEGRRYSAEYLRTGRQEAALREARRTDERVYDSMKQLVDVYEGMVNGLDMSPRQAAAALKDAGLSATDISMIVRGKVPDDLEDLKPGQLSKIFSKSSLEQRGKNEERMMTKEERAEARKTRQEYLKSLRESGAATGE